ATVPVSRTRSGAGPRRCQGGRSGSSASPGVGLTDTRHPLTDSGPRRIRLTWPAPTMWTRRTGAGRGVAPALLLAVVAGEATFTWPRSVRRTRIPAPPGRSPPAVPARAAAAPGAPPPTRAPSRAPRPCGPHGPGQVPLRDARAGGRRSEVRATDEVLEQRRQPVRATGAGCGHHHGPVGGDPHLDGRVVPDDDQCAGMQCGADRRGVGGQGRRFDD